MRVRFAIFSLAVLTAVLSTAAWAQVSQPQVDTPEGPTLPLPPPVSTRAAAPPDEVSRGDTVLTRPRPDYDPIGQRVGGFILYSDLSVQESYNSNVFYTPTGPKGDLITATNPSVDLKSNWGQNALNFHGDLDDVRYARYHVNNFTDYTVGSDGRLDIYHDARAYGAVGYGIRHLPVYSPNNVPGTRAPIQYSDLSGSLAGEKEFNRVSLRLDGNFDSYRYLDAQLADGTFSRQSLEDYDEKKVALHTGYEFQPGRQVYILTGYDWRDYTNSLDLSGFNRTSNGYTLAVGTKYDLTGLLFLDAYMGYRQQTYADSRLPVMSGPTGGLQLTWNMTRLTTLTGSVTRDIQETILAGASGYFATLAQVRADHELFRDLLLNVSVGYENDDFGSIGRTDDYYLAGAGAKYLINHNFWISGGYNYAHRESNQAGTNFDDHILFARISAHL